MNDSRPQPPYRADERDTLVGFLDFLRATILHKCEGLSDADLRSTPTASSLSLLGIVQHLGQVERYWFQGVMEDRTITFLWSEADPDGDFHVSAETSSAAVIQMYLDEIAESNRIAAAHGLDDLAAWSRSEDQRASLRYILTHMIEETARHCGHADIIRESIDGSTGE